MPTIALLLVAPATKLKGPCLFNHFQNFMIYTPSVQTTFLPKNNQLDPKERGYVRASKGRVFGTRPENGPKPPAPPFEEPTVVTKALFSDLNRYVVGQEIEAFSATWQGGNPDNQTYRSRWQYRATPDDPWENTSWTNHINQQVKFSMVITRPGVHRFNTQIRDSTVDPIYQSNQFSQSKTATVPATEIGDVSLSVNDVPHSGEGAITLLINDPVPAEIFFTGDANPTFKWEARSGYPMIVGEQAKQTVLTFPEAGAPTVTCTLTDSTSTDSPYGYAVNFYIVDAKTYEELKSNNQL